MAANQAFVLAFAHEALDDGKVTHAERAELQVISDLLNLNRTIIPALLERAENARNQRLSVGLKILPADWPHGDPLRVGDKVVFTGCDDALRAQLEQKSEKLGVRIIGGVSTKTSMLITDGTMDGTKATKARELGTRTVHPEVYAVLLEYLQPAATRGMRHQPPSSASLAARYAAPSTDGPALAVHSLPTSSTRPKPADVRAWARANGYEVGARGRLENDIIEAFRAAHAT